MGIFSGEKRYFSGQKKILDRLKKINHYQISLKKKFLDQV